MPYVNENTDYFHYVPSPAILSALPSNGGGSTATTTSSNSTATVACLSTSSPSSNHDHNPQFDPEMRYAGDVVSRKCGIRYLYRFELMGKAEDVEAGRSCSSCRRCPRSTGSVG
jgi:hypothetical protein